MPSLSIWASPKRTAAAAIIEEYEDSEAGQSTTTEMTDVEPISGRTSQASFLQNMFGRLVGSNSTEENDDLMRRGRPRPRRVQRQVTLSVPTDLLLRALLQRMHPIGDEEDITTSLEHKVGELSALLRRQLRHELHESTIWLLDAFDVLSAESGTPTSLGELGVASDQSTQLDSLSDRFIDELCALMQRANYRIFSQREWRFAQKENFMFTLPVTPVRP